MYENIQAGQEQKAMHFVTQPGSSRITCLLTYLEGKQHDKTNDDGPDDGTQLRLREPGKGAVAAAPLMPR
jgi:hypothetical protein